MKSNNSLTPLYFQFTLFADYGPLRYLYFILCLLIYMIIISANVVIILAVCLEKSLHQPMYIFICSLSFNSLYGSTGFFPRFLFDLLSDTHLMIYSLCIIQMCVIYSSAMSELTILSIMAYDRLVAICQPLHYHRKMTLKMMTQLVIFAMIYPALGLGYNVYLTIRLPLCGSKVQSLFCSVIQLSCLGRNVNNITGSFSTLISFFLPMYFVLYSYLRILRVCRRNSPELRRKALQTCLPHIVTFVTFLVSLFVELLLNRFKADDVNPTVIIALSLEFLIIPPITNPLVYGLSLPQIRGVIFRYFCTYLSKKSEYRLRK